MLKLFFIAGLLISPGQAEVNDRLVDFETEIIPILTRYGCNSGACHGAAVGRGNFHLSLFGSRPHDDYTAIVEQFEARRTNLADPRQSLLLLKPQGLVDHGGGVRLSEHDTATDSLLRWIQQGARRKQHRALDELRITITPHAPAPVDTLRRITCLADFRRHDSGLQRNCDVTHLTTFSAEDPTAVSISKDGEVRIKRPGRHVVIVRYLDRVIPVEILVPFESGDVTPGQPSKPPGHPIDIVVEHKAAELRVPIADPLGDEQIVRRLSLDLAGRVPLAMPEHLKLSARPLDRKPLIDELLNSEEFVDFWTFQMMQMLMLNSVGDTNVATNCQTWMKSMVAQDASMAEVVKDLLAAEGPVANNGPAAFYLVRTDARSQAEYLTESFAGIRLRCANCHDHPLDRWTQDDYHGLSAIFASVSRGTEIRRNGRGTVIHPGTGLPAIPKIPGRDLNQDVQLSSEHVADWLLDTENPLFARHFVNRVWSLLTGRGLVHPVDDLRPTNLSPLEPVLTRLTSDFVESGYRLKPLLRTICSTDVYARSSHPDRTYTDLPGLFACSQNTPLSAEVLLDAICDVTGVAESFDGYPLGTRAIQLPSSKLLPESLNLPGRCPEPVGCASGNENPQPDVSTFLGLLNGPLINHRLQHESCFLNQAPFKNRPVSDQIREIYLRALNRQPTQAEADLWSRHISMTNSSTEKQEVLEDLLWSIIVSREFSQ
ncbi:MAG: DUF1553 domain-containing protein [Planctomyces sp.]|nr:DUF1553 domain-containing protein [Planctomyces sp.]